MKSVIKYLFVLAVIWSCSSDNSEGEVPEEANFSFQISGAINKTISGSQIFYNETFTDVKNFEGNDVTLSTVFIVAQDATTECQVTIGITRESSVGSGNYPVGTDIFTFYNVFMNFSGDAGTSISFQSESGGIDVDSNSGGFVTGSVNVTLPGTGEEGGAITVTGNFAASSI